jgi:hypothetical protein
MNPQAIKLASEKRLAVLGVRTNEHLSMIEDPVQLTPRSAQQVSTRAYVLSHVICVGYGRSGSEMRKWLTEAGLADALTPREKDFLKQRRYSEHDRAWAAWQFASAHACAWALGLEEMAPLGECPDTLASHFPPKTKPKPDASLRSFDAIYAEADFYYRLHWAARQSRLEGADFPRPEIEIQLRRQSLDWIVGLPYEWDDVPADT